MGKAYYTFVKQIARVIFPKRKMVWEEGVVADENPAIYICNHSGISSPVAVELYFNLPKRVWITCAMLNKETGVNYFFHDMMLGRSAKNPKKLRHLTKYVIALIRPLIYKNNKYIVVNKAGRDIRNTIEETLSTLNDGKNVIIFPEKHFKYGKFINSFHHGFVDVARLYCKRTGKPLNFYPMYIGGDNNSINIGKPIAYDLNNKRPEEAKRICEYLQQSIEEIGASLPDHNVIPYVPEAFYEYYPEYIDDEEGFYQFVNQPYSE